MIKLPSLSAYRDNFVNKGLTLPLKTVPFSETGLLQLLPAVASELKGWPWSQEVSPSDYHKSGVWPKLTIVTPSYNQGKFLEQTIRSVLLQNYPNLEYIVIDGGSTDNTADVLKKYEPWISYWQSEKDNGQGHAINQGFSIASGAYFAWINSDDYYLANTFIKVMDLFIKKACKFVYGYGLNFDTSSRKYTLVKVLPHTDYFIKIPSLMQPATFWDAGIHQPIWEELHCALDFELWLRLIKGNKRELIKQPLAVANVHDDAKTHNVGMKAKWDEDHNKMWAEDAHGRVDEWQKLVFLNRIRVKLFQWFFGY